MVPLKKLASIVSAALLALCLGGLLGCSKEASESTPADQAPTLEVTQAGATVQLENAIAEAEGDFDKATAQFVFEVANNNAGKIAQNIVFDVTGFNENGLTIFTGEVVVETVYPYVPTVVTGTAQMDAVQATEGPVASVKVDPILTNVEWTDSALSESQLQNLFTIENQVANGTDDILTVTATVTGDLSDAAKLVNTTSIDTDVLAAHCVTVLFDDDGNMMMGSESSSVLIDQDFLDRVNSYNEEKASGERDVSVPTNLISSISSPPDFGSYKVYVMPSLA